MPQYRLIAAAHVPLRIALSDLETKLPSKFTMLPFGGIDVHGTEQLLRSREGANGFEYTQNAISRAHVLSGGHPRFLRYLGERIVVSAKTGKIDVADIDSAFSQVVKMEALPHLQTDYHDDTDDTHRQILAKLAEDPSRTRSELRILMPASLTGTDFNKHYDDLMDMGLLVSDTTIGRDKPNFPNEFLTAYIQHLCGSTYVLPPVAGELAGG
jgi:hypothetical protein